MCPEKEGRKRLRVRGLPAGQCVGRPSIAASVFLLITSTTTGEFFMVGFERY